MRHVIYSRSLERATEILGGVESLAEYLKVSPELLRAWMSGDASVPGDAFLKAVDLVLHQRAAPGA